MDTLSSLPPEGTAIAGHVKEWGTIVYVSLVAPLLDSSTITMTMYYKRLNRRGADNSEVGDDKGSRDGEEDSMKQIIEYIRSYSKALLQKMGM